MIASVWKMYFLSLISVSTKAYLVSAISSDVSFDICVPVHETIFFFISTHGFIMSKFLTSEVSSTVGYKLLCRYLSMSLPKSTFCGFSFKYNIMYIYSSVLIICCHIQIKIVESLFLCLSFYK